MLEHIGKIPRVIITEMSTETAKWQILSFCCVLMLRYSFMGYATLPALRKLRIAFFA